MTTLRTKLIRLAHETPAFRPHLLPLLKAASHPIAPGMLITIDPSKADLASLLKLVNVPGIQLRTRDVGKWYVYNVQGNTVRMQRDKGSKFLSMEKEDLQLLMDEGIATAKEAPLRK
jgi:hypothetical protein